MFGAIRCVVRLRATQEGAPPPRDPRERARWDRLRVPGDRDRLATGHHLLVEAAAQWLSMDPSRVRLRRRCPGCGSTEHGPVSVDGLSVSVSHSGALVAVALTAGPQVGVDVEAVSRQAPDVAEHALTPAERREHQGSRTPHDLLIRWVRKEAVLKAARTGLTQGLQGLRVSDPARRARVVSWSGPSRPRGAHRAALVDLDLPLGYVGCVAVLTARRLSLEQLS